MNPSELRELLEMVAQSVVGVDEAAERLASGPFRHLASQFVTPDAHRGIRLGLAEVIYGASKTVDEIVEISAEASKADVPVLITRLDESQLARLQSTVPGARVNERARTVLINAPAARGAESGNPFVAIVTAGTGDVAVAEEAAEVCIAMEVAYEKIIDVGVAGVHRLAEHLPLLRKAAAVIVIAGMDGALVSLVGGLVAQPVIGVPTSVGYGAAFGGAGALLAMLNSCAPGVTVTNIDNGFAAGFAACRIVRLVEDQSRRGAVAHMPGGEERAARG